MPGKAWIDSLVETINEEYGDHDPPTDDLSGVTVKMDGDRMRASLRGARGSVVEDVLVPKTGNVHLTLDGHTYQLNHETMMEVLRKRAEHPKIPPMATAPGPYRTAPHVVPVLASAKARPSKWHRRWMHYARWFLRRCWWYPVVGFVVNAALLAWNGKSFGVALAGGMIAGLAYIPLSIPVGALEMRDALRARTRRAAKIHQTMGDLAVSVLERAVKVKDAPMLRDRKEKPNDPTPEHPVEIRDLVKLLLSQGFDGERVEILRVPPTSLTVAMAARLLRTFDHDSSRLKALEYVARNITDREHASVIVEAFDLGSSKVKALRLVREAQS